jgi:hypothetical protein
MFRASDIIINSTYRRHTIMPYVYSRVSYKMYIKFTSQDGGGVGGGGPERESHNKLKKSNSIAVTEHGRHSATAMPPAHDGASSNSATGKSSFIQRRRLRQPVWARTTTTQKKLLPNFISTLF